MLPERGIGAEKIANEKIAAMKSSKYSFTTSADEEIATGLRLFFRSELLKVSARTS